VCVCMHACMHVCVHACMYACVHKYLIVWLCVWHFCVSVWQRVCLAGVLSGRVCSSCRFSYLCTLPEDSVWSHYRVYQWLKDHSIAVRVDRHHKAVVFISDFWWRLTLLTYRSINLLWPTGHTSVTYRSHTYYCQDKPYFG